MDDDKSLLDLRIEGVKVSVEYGYLCFRSETGWLLRNLLISDISPLGVSLSDIVESFDWKDGK